MGLKVRGTRTLPTKFFSVFSSFVDKGDIMGGIELGRLPAKVNNTGRYSLSPYEQRPFANYIKKTIPNTIRRLSGQVLTILHTSASCIWPTDLLATGGIGQSGRTSRHWSHLSRKSTLCMNTLFIWTCQFLMSTEQQTFRRFQQISNILWKH